MRNHCVLPFCAVVCLTWSAAGFGQDRSDKLVAFILADEGLRGSEIDAKRIEGLITSGVNAVKAKRPEGTLAYTPLPFVKILDMDFTRSDLIDLFKSCNLLIDNRTTVVIYCKVHGTRDERGSDDPKKHTLYLRNIDSAKYKVTRYEILEWIGARHPRLVVLLTDTCSLHFEDRFGKETFPAPDPKIVADRFEALFLEPKGVVDITAASNTGRELLPLGAPFPERRVTGEGAWSALNGGLFTQAFIESYDKFQVPARDPGGHRAPWDKFFDEVATNTERWFSKFRQKTLDAPDEFDQLSDYEKAVLKAQKKQTPHRFRHDDR